MTQSLDPRASPLSPSPVFRAESIMKEESAHDVRSDPPSTSRVGYTRQPSSVRSTPSTPPRASTVDPSTIDHDSERESYLITTAQVPYRMPSSPLFYGDAPGSLEGWPHAKHLWPDRESPCATLQEATPSTVVRRGSLVLAANDTALVHYLFTLTETPAKQWHDEPSLVNTLKDWDPQNPYTWPTVHLPFYLTPNISVPSHIDEMLVHVHFMGLGARLLRKPLYEAMEEMKTEDEKAEIGRMAFNFWPFNVTQDGWWKGASGISDEEVEAWRENQREN